MAKRDHHTIHVPPTMDGRRRRGDTGRQLRAPRSGFTLVEILIGLAISAMLLTAVAVAFNASVVNYAENEEMYETINNARQALTRMTSELRTGYAVNPVAPAGRCDFTTAAGDAVVYELNGTNLRVQKNGGTPRVLCSGVTACTFTKAQTDDGMDSKSVQISLTVRSGNFSRTLSAAAVIRRNLPF